jgi:hypothetical protein
MTQITVDNCHICNFPARITANCVTALGITGDVVIHTIHFENFKDHNGGGQLEDSAAI